MIWNHTLLLHLIAALIVVGLIIAIIRRMRGAR